VTKPAPDAEMAKTLRAARRRVLRTRRALREAEEARWELVQAGLAAGLSATKLARETGLHVSRIYQIGRGECGSED